VETNPVPVKELLSMAGLCRRDPRLPLVPVSEKSLTRLVQFYEGTLAAMLAQDTAGGGA
jgi:dihydrodipicolinate synthase/N-acetylneuraminate lyase